jgi:TolA-binding protein
MEERDLHIDLFEKYLEGSLDERNVLEFEARLSYDSNFKQEFEEYKVVEQGIRNHFRKEMKSKFGEIDKDLDNASPKRPGKSRKLFYWSAAAASLLIGVLLFQHFSANENELLATQYWPEEPGLPVKMSTKGKYDDAMNAYKLGEFDKSYSLLNKISSDTSYYFQGVIGYEQSDIKKAMGFFNQIDKSSNYYNSAQFRLGLISLSEGDLGSAKKIFNSQISQKTEFAEASNEILKKI